MLLVKRLIDIIISLILIIATAPVMIITALAIALDSPGPILYRRLPDGRPVMRYGKYGRQFHYFKFRSMRYLNNGHSDEITRVGNFIRRWHIDELPELFLVLIGRMSLVGPRPGTYDNYCDLPHEYFSQLDMKPGMTGPSQLHGKAFLMEEKIRLDLEYIRSWTIAQDLKIILLTPVIICRQRCLPHFYEKASSVP